MGDDNGQAPDFQAALAEEFGYTPEPEAPATPPAPTPSADASDKGEAEQPTPSPAVTEEPVPPKEPSTPPNGEPETPQDGEVPKTPQAPENGTADIRQSLSKDDIKAAITELNQETSSRVEQVHQAREEIISTIYPEGIDRTIYDSNGNAIKTAQDIVDRGLVKENGEPFTYEEAASFMLEANRKMTENVEELNKWAEDIAEQNMSLVESNQRVMDKWGETLKAMPKLAQELAQEYITTQLQFDKTGSYITKMNMSPETYYDRIMAPYYQLAQSMAAAEAAKANEQHQQAQATQQERNGLPPQRGTSATRPNTGDPMLDALVEELAKE